MRLSLGGMNRTERECQRLCHSWSNDTHCRGSLSGLLAIGGRCALGHRRKSLASAPFKVPPERHSATAFQDSTPLTFPCVSRDCHSIRRDGDDHIHIARANFGTFREQVQHVPVAMTAAHEPRALTPAIPASRQTPSASFATAASASPAAVALPSPANTYPIKVAGFGSEEVQGRIVVLPVLAHVSRCVIRPRRLMHLTDGRKGSVL